MIPSKTLEDLGWARLLEYVAERAHTDRGADRVRGLEFFDRADDAAARSDEIGEARSLAASGVALPFGGISDVREAVALAAKGATLDGEGLLDVARATRGAHELARHLERHAAEAPRLASRTEVVADLGHVYQPIASSFEPGGARLADGASPSLGGLRRRVVSLKAQLDHKAQTLVDDPRLQAHLQDNYFTLRDERYVVPVRVEARSAVKGIVHGTSHSGRTLFVEPEVMVDLNNSLKIAECDVADEERRILGELSATVAADADAIVLALEVATELDVIDACARFADDLIAEPAVIDPDGGFELRRARHPLMVASGKPCVPNDLSLAPRSVLVISGPNAGGKTVALKTAGLVALMVRAGLHVPAGHGSRAPWLTNVLCDIGDAQSIENDLSTFSAHLVALREFLASAGADTLVLIDEVAVGTEPEQGAALARAVLEELADRGAPTIVTTHYEALKALAAADPRFANASVGFDLDKMEPTFRLHLGTPGSSGALRVGRRMGLPAAVLDRAEQVMGEGRASVEELMLSLERARRELDEERAATAEARERAERATREAESARAAADDRRRKLHEGLYDGALDALRDARRELDELKSQVKRRRVGVEAAAEARARVDTLASALAENAPARPEPPGRAVSADELTPGTRVFVASLGREGEVVAAPERGKVQVAVGAMRTTAAVDDLRLVAARPKKKPAARAAASKPRRVAAPVESAEVADAEEPAFMRTPDATVDVRGERAHDAVSRVDKFIDDSMQVERECIFVIHGHGTGALRSAVRELLAGHHAIARFRAGLPAEGGDGVTVAWLSE